MNKLKLYDFQRKIIEDKSRTIICNLTRGLGKDFIALNKIIINKPKTVLWVDKSSIHLQDKIKEIIELNNIGNLIQIVKINNNNLQIKYKNGLYTEIINYYENSKDRECNKNRLLDRYVDLIIFNNILPFNLEYKGKQVISMITINNYDKKLQRLFPQQKIHEYDYHTAINEGLMTNAQYDTYFKSIKGTYSNAYYDEIAILDNPKIQLRDNININRKNEILLSYPLNTQNKFLIETLIGLQEEYDKTDKIKNTILTRQNLLKMILDIKHEIENIN